MSKLPAAASVLLAALIVSPASWAQAQADLYAKDIPRPLRLACSKFPSWTSAQRACPLPQTLPIDDGDSGVANSDVRVPLVLSAGTPIRIAIDQRTRLEHVGQPVHGKVVETVYVFDEPVIPAGTIATGRVTHIETLSAMHKVESYANADFTPARSYAVSFDHLSLPDGTELDIQTTVSSAAPHVVHLTSKPETDSDGETSKTAPQSHIAGRAASAAKHVVKETAQDASSAAHQAASEIRAPGKMQRLREFLGAQLPYRHQYINEGTRFSASLNQPIDFGAVTRTQGEIASLGSDPPANLLVHAHLLLELSSATATRGNPVVAEVTEPVYSPDHHLIIPSQTRLIGQVVEAKPARRLHRNGELRVIFEHIEIPGSDLQRVQGSLEGIEVDRQARLRLDEEGGAHATESKTRYLSTGAALLMVVAAAHPDVDHGNFSEASGDPVVRAGAGASGFGLAGSVIGLALKSNAVSLAFSAYGASTSIYANFLSRGHDVVLPKNVPMEIGLGIVHPQKHSH